MSLLVSWAVFPALLAIIFLGCGLAAERAAGHDLPTALLLPVGFGVAVVAGCLITAEPSLAKLTTPLVLLITIAGLLGARRYSPLGRRRAGR